MPGNVRAFYWNLSGVTQMRRSNAHDGSTFDSFLEREGIQEEVRAVAIMRVVAWQLEQAMQEQQKAGDDELSCPNQHCGWGGKASKAKLLRILPLTGSYLPHLTRHAQTNRVTRTDCRVSGCSN
jgi:hypothetical protein